MTFYIGTFFEVKYITFFIILNFEELMFIVLLILLTVSNLIKCLISLLTSLINSRLDAILFLLVSHNVALN